MPSSVIRAIRYEPRRRELLIVFRGGRGTYRYFQVQAEEWRGFLEAESKGSYLNEVFKRKEHPYIRLMEPVRNGASLEAEDWRQSGGEERRQAEGESGEVWEWGESWSLPRPRVQRVEAEESAEKIRA
jgi:hypothetical protein